VLVASVWMTAIILLLAGAFNLFTERQVQFATILKDQLKLGLDQSSTEQTLLYMFATHRFTVAGLSTQEELESDYVTDEGNVLNDAIGGELRLDGTYYQGVGKTLFSINDYAGLLALNSETNYHLAQVLRTYESDPIKHQELINRLSDYRDKDDFIRLNGAEKNEYIKAKQTVPPNDRLRSPGEILKVLGWRDWLASHPEFDCMNWCSTNWQSAVNPNTLPDELFRRLPGMTEEIAHRLLQIRIKSPFRSPDDLIQKSHGFVVLQDNYYRFFPAGQVRIRIFSAENRKLSTIAVNFTPFDLSHAWSTEYRYNSERNFEITKPVHQTAIKYFGE